MRELQNAERTVLYQGEANVHELPDGRKAHELNGQGKLETIGFEGQPNYNEIKYADKISKSFNTNHFVKMVSPNDLLDFIPKITDIYDEPQADTTAIPIYFISQLAKKEHYSE